MILYMVEKVIYTFSEHYSTFFGALCAMGMALLDSMPEIVADGISWPWVLKIAVGGLIGGGIGMGFRLAEKWLNLKAENKHKKPKNETRKTPKKPIQ